TWGRSIPVSSAGNVFHVSPIFIYTSDNTRGSSHTLVQSAGNVFHRSPACIYIRDLTRGRCYIPVLSAGNVFSDKSRLYIYQRAYTGEKPYVCPECGKYFSVKPSLHTHQRSYTEERSCIPVQSVGNVFQRSPFFIYDRYLIRGKSCIGDKRVSESCVKALRLIYCMGTELYVLNYMFKLRRGSPGGS
ncbi:unnamed protein product, partial [Staurois parvus]